MDGSGTTPDPFSGNWAYLSAAAAGHPGMKQVTIERLACSTTEDTLGSDECRLEIYADGEFERSFRGDLNDGESWDLYATLLFGSEVGVRLFDEDGPLPGDDDDALGVVTIGTDDATSATASFTQDGADYTLTYSVIDRSDLPAVDLVEAELTDFEASGEPGVWANVDKGALIADMRATIADPVGQVDQNSSQFCGPTSIVFELVSRMPRRYVRLCRQLFKTGSFDGRTKSASASEGLRGASVGQGMSPADWMLIATMRESENAIFGVDPDADGVTASLQGMTTPWEIEGWVSEILLEDTTAISTTFVWGEMDALRYAEEVYAAGGVAFMMIHDVLLSGDDDSTVPPWPTHWVVYRGGLWEDPDGGTVDFDVYTWGSVRHVGKSADRFESCMFGIVTGF